MIRQLPWTVLLMWLMLDGGCSGQEAATPASPTPTASLPAGEEISVGGLKFRAPADWVKEPPSSSMRLAQYRLSGVGGDSEDAELVVYYFGGSGGSVQANVDRWIGQFTKADGSPANDVASVSERQANELRLTVMDVSGTYHEPRGPMMARTEPKPNHRMLSAVAEGPGGPWFFKLTGPRNTVDHWEQSFYSLLDSLETQPVRN